MLKILAINPGSTSTKIGIYHDSTEVLTKSISHSSEDLARFAAITDQLDYRLTQVTEFLSSQNINPACFDAIVGRGGLLKPVVSGTYIINQTMLNDLTQGSYGAHASNLGAILASMLAKHADCPAFIVDPVVVDELEPLARLSGRPEINRKSIFHALNQKAVAKRYAKTVDRHYEELNLIVAHLGGGISVGCHKQGRVVEVNNALDGEGPFSPERAGTIPAGQWAAYVADNTLSQAEVSKLLAGKAGLVAYLGTNDAREVEKRITEGDDKAALVYDAMIYQTARAIAAAAVPLSGNADYIILTGGMAYSEYLTTRLKDYVEFIAPVIVIPGENELQSLAEGAYRVLINEESAKTYI